MLWFSLFLVSIKHPFTTKVFQDSTDQIFVLNMSECLKIYFRKPKYPALTFKYKKMVNSFTTKIKDAVPLWIKLGWILIMHCQYYI